MAVFQGCMIVLDLTTNTTFKKKLEIKKRIIENGGVVSYIVTKQCTHVVASDPEKADVSYKCKMAAKYGIPVVSPDFIHDCAEEQKLLHTDAFIVAGKTKSEEFSSGKIVASTYQKKEKKKKVKPVFNVKSIKAWPYQDKNAPEFEENQFEIAKYAMFKKTNTKTNSTDFCVLEIHVLSQVTQDTNRSDVFPFRIFSHKGTWNTEDGSQGNKECRFVKTSEETLAVYAQLYREQLEYPVQKTVTHELIGRNIGSDKFQQMQAKFGLEINCLKPEVAELVEHIWREATGEIEDILSLSIGQIKIDQVEKAEAVLIQIREQWTTGADNSQVSQLVDDFYSSLPHKPACINKDISKSWLAKKQDVCQLIRDMLTVSETTDWSTRSSTEAKYRALRCHVECLTPDDVDFSVVSHLVMESKHSHDLSIENVFAVRCLVEDNDFRTDIHPKQLLFHASKVENYVGILSRGLLLPKVVVDDFGGSRTDAGNLGHGIYFASASSTSISYSQPSKTKGSRMMLVNEVALGQCKEYTTVNFDLTEPPDGCQSVHGVSSSESMPTQFKDDEYVVYNKNQQKISYLVEFRLHNDKVSTLDYTSTDELILDDIPPTVEAVDVGDVKNVVDPLSKIEAGLVADGGGTVQLLEVHVRARLIDLAAEVVVLQEYYNFSDVPLEAKYVFPLDDMAAVCGFEIFINGKHIIGEVKEKETAHREYREAIREGHGAYLMDQDEETPDVFTVSVGNLPVNAHVMVKITYVTELLVEDELINFQIPGNVAPWKKTSASQKPTQFDQQTVQVEGEKSSVHVAIEMPFELRQITCPTHRIQIKKTATKAVVMLSSGQSIVDGFQLQISLAEIHVPRMWVEQLPDSDSQACMLTFYPEFEAVEEDEVEVVFLLDSSNSMRDQALIDAKKVLLLCLHHLPPQWLFNIVIFGTAFRELFPTSQHKTLVNHKLAEELVKSTKASMGNTEVYRPLQSLYLLRSQSSFRNVFLVSDGHLNNVETTLDAVSSNCQHTRIFTFGVSSIVNQHLLRSIGRVGAGAYEFFGTKLKSQWEKKVKSQLSRAAQPGLTDIAVAWQQYDSDLPPPHQAPRQISALFNGARQVIYGYVPNCLMATLKAHVADQEVSTVVSTSDLSVTKGKIVHCLTAKAIIRDWEDGALSSQRAAHEIAKMNMKTYIIELSKKYNIVTKLTSFVAVEKREKDEKQRDSLSDIEDLVEKEDIDILKYIAWDEASLETSSSEEEEESQNSSSEEFETSDSEEDFDCFSNISFDYVPIDPRARLENFSYCDNAYEDMDQASGFAPATDEFAILHTPELCSLEQSFYAALSPTYQSDPIQICDEAEYMSPPVTHPMIQAHSAMFQETETKGRERQKVVKLKRVTESTDIQLQDFVCFSNKSIDYVPIDPRARLENFSYCENNYEDMGQASGFAPATDDFAILHTPELCSLEKGAARHFSEQSFYAALSPTYQSDPIQICDDADDMSPPVTHPIIQANSAMFQEIETKGRERQKEVKFKRATESTDIQLSAKMSCTVISQDAASHVQTSNRILLSQHLHLPLTTDDIASPPTFGVPLPLPERQEMIPVAMSAIDRSPPSARRHMVAPTAPPLVGFGMLPVSSGPPPPPGPPPAVRRAVVPAAPSSVASLVSSVIGGHPSPAVKQKATPSEASAVSSVISGPLPPSEKHGMPPAALPLMGSEMPPVSGGPPPPPCPPPAVRSVVPPAAPLLMGSEMLSGSGGSPPPPGPPPPPLPHRSFAESHGVPAVPPVVPAALPSVAFGMSLVPGGPPPPPNKSFAVRHGVVPVGLPSKTSAISPVHRRQGLQMFRRGGMVLNSSMSQMTQEENRDDGTKEEPMLSDRHCLKSSSALDVTAHALLCGRMSGKPRQKQKLMSSQVLSQLDIDSLYETKRDGRGVFDRLIRRSDTLMQESGTLIQEEKAVSEKDRKKQTFANINKVLKMQTKHGYWENSPELSALLDVDFDVCLQMLFAAGLKSLGEKVSTEIIHLVMTLMVLWSIAKKIKPFLFPVDLQDSRNIKNITDMITTELKSMYEKGEMSLDKAPETVIQSALNFNKSVSQSYPLVCSSLELGKNWDEIVGKTLGLQCHQEIIDVEIVV